MATVQSQSALLPKMLGGTYHVHFLGFHTSLKPELMLFKSNT